MGETPQDRGRSFEDEWADLFGVKPVRGSGNQWFAPLDVGDGRILWSLKHTDKDRFTITPTIIMEAIQASFGPMGSGDTQPGWALSIGGRRFVMLEADTFLPFVTREVEPYRPPTKVEEKKARASVNRLARLAQEEDDV